MSDLPADWRERMVDMIRGAADLDGAWFTGGPALEPVAQIGVYREQYRLRLYDALVEEVPGLSALLDDDARERLLRAYLADHPSKSWTLNRVADGLADWLERRGAPVAQVEMARLDRAVQRGFEAAEGRSLRAEDLLSMPRLRLQPHVTVLRTSHNVHRIRSAGLLGQQPPPLARGDFPLVVFRRGIKMRHWEVPLGSWGILAGIADGLDVGAAIERTFERGWLDAEALTANIGPWFREYAERNLVELGSTV